MVAAEIVLILIGVVFIVVSFFVTEKLSQQDLEQISLMSQADLKVIAEKQVNQAKIDVENRVEEVFDEALEITKRGLERETNNKIMAVSEYSDTVLENINKSHNEVMFLYSMLKDKQTEVADMIGVLQRYVKEIRDMDVEATLARVEEYTPVTNTVPLSNGAAMMAEPAQEFVQLTEAVSIPEVKETEFAREMEDVVLSKNEQILLLHKEGKDEVEIAKTMDCGLGEVRLILGLYNEA